MQNVNVANMFNLYYPKKTVKEIVYFSGFT